MIESFLKQVLQRVRQWMESACLTLHPEKTRIVDMGELNAYFDFLGYRFKRSRRTGKLMRLVRPQSEKKLRAKIKKATKRCNRNSMETIIAKINPTLRGWHVYFKHVKVSHLGTLNGWIRMRLRSIKRKRRKGRGRGRGADHQRWPNHYFAKLGLFSLKQAKEEEISLRGGAKC